MSREQEPWEKAVGISLALASGVFIGSSFIFKKKGLLDTNALGHAPAQGHAYLKSKMWWAGMILMGVGELANFGAYAFVPAILVTPLGALSVVIAAVLSSIFLKERLDFSGKIGCLQCVLGAIIIVLNAPENNSTETIDDFFSYVMTPLFLIYSCLVFGSIFYLIRRVAPVYGELHPIVYISICSLMGSYLVLSAQGFGSSIVYTIANYGVKNTNQLLCWPIYPLFAFVIFAVFMQINYLNKALNLFSTAIVTPVYYVFFTGATLLTSAILFRGFKKTGMVEGISIIIGFCIIVGGVSLLFAFSLKEGAMKKNGVMMGSKSNCADESAQDLELESSAVKSNRVRDFDPVPTSNDEDDDKPLSEDSEHVVVEMRRVDTSGSGQQRMTVIPAFTKKTTQNVMNPNKVRHSPTPSFDNAITFATRGIAATGHGKAASNAVSMKSSVVDDSDRSRGPSDGSEHATPRRRTPNGTTVIEKATFSVSDENVNKASPCLDSFIGGDFTSHENLVQKSKDDAIW